MFSFLSSIEATERPKPPYSSLYQPDLTSPGATNAEKGQCWPPMGLNQLMLLPKSTLKLYKKCVLKMFGVTSAPIAGQPQDAGSINLLLVASISVSVSMSGTSWM